MSYHDRGMHKVWTGLMMPEHNKMLREFFDQDGKEELKLLSDEHMFFIHDNVLEACEYNREVIVTHHKNQRYVKTIGHIHAVHDNKLRVVDSDGDIHIINVLHLLDVDFK